MQYHSAVKLNALVVNAISCVTVLALKPSPGQPGHILSGSSRSEWKLSRSDPDWITCNRKLRNKWYGGATNNNANVNSLWTMLTRTLVSVSAWKQHPCFVCICMHKIQPCIEPRPRIDCYCRPQKCYLCSMSASQGIAAVQSTCIRLLLHFHLFKPHPGTCKLAGATYSAIHYIYWSIAIPISYHGYMYSYVPSIC